MVDVFVWIAVAMIAVAAAIHGLQCKDIDV